MLDVSGHHGMAESAFIVRIPEAEAWIGPLRARYDPVVELGVPAHITLVYPFMSPESIGESEWNAIRAVCRAFRPFEISFERIERFSSSLYLAPEPSAPLVGLIEALVRAFPDYPPYGGQFETIIPHLTVAGDAASLDVAEAELVRIMGRRGPIVATCSQMELYENSAGVWRPLRSFGFAGNRSPELDGSPNDVPS